MTLFARQKMFKMEKKKKKNSKRSFWSYCIKKTLEYAKAFGTQKGVSCFTLESV